MALAVLLAVAAALALAALCLRRYAALLHDSRLRPSHSPPPAPRAAAAAAAAQRRLLTWHARRLGAVLLSAALLRQARRHGLSLSVGGLGYLSAAEITITAAKGPVRRVTVRDASYTGPLMSLLQWSAEWLRRRAARHRSASAAAPGTPGTPSAAPAHAAARLRLPVTLRGLRITVQARAAPAAGCAGAATPPPRTPPPRGGAFGGGAAPVTPPPGGLARSGSLLAPRQLLASGRWRLVARAARLLDVTLADVSIDVLPARPDATAPALQLRLRHVALSAGGPGGAALRLSARADGISARLRRRRTRGASFGGAADAATDAAAALDAANWEDAAPARGPDTTDASPLLGGADVAVLAWLQLGADVEHDALAGATRCSRLEADAGALAGALAPELAAALRACLPQKAPPAPQAGPPRGVMARMPASTALSLESLSLAVGPPAAGLHLSASALNLCCHAPPAMRGFAAAELLWSADCSALSVAPRSAASAASPPKAFVRAARLGCEAAMPLAAMDEAPAPGSAQVTVAALMLRHAPDAAAALRDAAAALRAPRGGGEAQPAPAPSSPRGERPRPRWAVRVALEDGVAAEWDAPDGSGRAASATAASGEVTLGAAAPAEGPASPPPPAFRLQLRGLRALLGAAPDAAPNTSSEGLPLPVAIDSLVIAREASGWAVDVARGRVDAPSAALSPAAAAVQRAAKMHGAVWSAWRGAPAQVAPQPPRALRLCLLACEARARAPMCGGGGGEAARCELVASAAAVRALRRPAGAGWQLAAEAPRVLYREADAERPVETSLLVAAALSLSRENAKEEGCRGAWRVSGDDVALRWEPDAHFLAQRISADWRAHRTALSGAAPQAGPACAGSTQQPCVALDFTRLSCELAPSACLSARLRCGALRCADALRCGAEASALRLTLNGGADVAAAEALRLSPPAALTAEGDASAAVASATPPPQQLSRSASAELGSATLTAATALPRATSGLRRGGLRRSASMERGRDGAALRAGALLPEPPGAPPRRAWRADVTAAQLTLPHGVDLGAAISAFETFFGAFRAAGGAPFLPPRAQPRPAPAAAASSPPAPLTELLVRLHGGARVCAADAPRETWLAARRRAAAAAEAALQEEGPDAAFAAFRTAFPAAAEAAPADLLSLTADEAEILLVFGGGPPAAAAAAALAAQLDPAGTGGVALRVARAACADVSLVRPRLALRDQAAPLLAADALCLSGPVIMARQAATACLPRPGGAGAVAQRVGRRRSAHRAAAPPPDAPAAALKLWTDLKLAGTALSVTLSPAALAELADVARAIEAALTPPRASPRAAAAAAAAAGEAPLPPPRALPPPAGRTRLQFWDRVRYSWRGRLRATLHRAELRLAAGTASPALAAAFTLLELDLRGPAASLRADRAQLLALEAGPAQAGPPAVLLALPAASAGVELTWRAADGRDPARHALLPEDSDIDGDVAAAPRALAGFRAAGLAVAARVSLRPRQPAAAIASAGGARGIGGATPPGGTPSPLGPMGTGAGTPCRESTLHASPGDAAHSSGTGGPTLWVGPAEARLLRRWAAAWHGARRAVAGAALRRRFGEPPRPPRERLPPLPALLRAASLSLEAARATLAAPPGDAAEGLACGAACVTLDAEWSRDDDDAALDEAATIAAASQPSDATATSAMHQPLPPMRCCGMSLDVAALRVTLANAASPEPPREPRLARRLAMDYSAMGAAVRASPPQPAPLARTFSTASADPASTLVLFAPSIRLTRAAAAAALSDGDGGDGAAAEADAAEAGATRIVLDGLRLIWNSRCRDALWGWGARMGAAAAAPAGRLGVARRAAAALAAPDAAAPGGATPPRTPAPGHRRSASNASNGSDTSELGGPAPAPRLPPRASESGAAAGASAAGRVVYIIDIRAPQFNLEAEEEAGQLLLAASGGLVVCRDAPAGARAWALELRRAQAHAACDDDDAENAAAPQWINALDADGVASPEGPTSPKGTAGRGTSKLKPIFAPCTIAFEATLRDDGAGGDGSFEAALRSPALEASTDARQYAVLFDVVTNLLLSPAAGGAADPADAAAALLAAVAARAAERRAPGGLARRRSAFAVETTRAGAAAVSEVAAALADASLLGASSDDAPEAAARLRCALAAANAAARGAARTPAFRVTLELGSASWRLRHRGATFLAASLAAFALTSEQAEDCSGALALRLHRLALRDASASAGAATGTGTALLEAWDPAGVFGAEPMLAVTARRAAAPRAAPVYELLDVCLAPARVALTEALVVQLQAFFMPPDPLDKGLRDERRPAATPAKAPRGKASVAALDALETPQRSVARHRRVGSWDAGGGVSFADAAPTPATPAPTPARRRSVVPAPRGPAPPPEPRRLSWELVRFNEVMVAVSYSGSPVSFQDVRLLLDARVYRGIAGRWRDLYARLKKDLIWSVLKSITGLHGRKLADWHASSQRARDALARSAEERSDAAGGGGEEAVAPGGATPGPRAAAPPHAHRAGVPLPPRRRGIWKRVFARAGRRSQPSSPRAVSPDLGAHD